MMFWYHRDELWPDIDVSTSRPVMVDRNGNERPLLGWYEADAPPELVALYVEHRDAFLATRDALIYHIYGEDA